MEIIVAESVCVCVCVCVYIYIFFQNLSFHYVINLLIIIYFVHADLEKTMLQRCSGVYTLGQSCK